MKLVAIFLGLVAFTIANAIPNEENEVKSIDYGIEQRLSQLEETVEKQIAEQKRENIKRQADATKRDVMEDVILSMKTLIASEFEKYQAAHRTCESGRATTGWLKEDGKYELKIPFERVFPRKPAFTLAIYGWGQDRDTAQTTIINSDNLHYATVTTSEAVIKQSASSNVAWIRFSWIACL